MRTIRYEYQNNISHGAICNEKYPAFARFRHISPALVQTPLPRRAAMAETAKARQERSTMHSFAAWDPECTVCGDYEDNHPPQQMLDHYTDFQGHLTQLGYDTNWYINR